MDVDGRIIGARNRQRITENATFYRKLIQALVANGWKRFLEEPTKCKDEEIIPLLTSVYAYEGNARNNVDVVREMFRTHRGKIEADIQEYLINGEREIYPPSHEIYTRMRLFPFLDQKMPEIFQPLTFPNTVPLYIIHEAAEHLNPILPNDDRLINLFFNNLRTQSIKWLAMKLLPAELHPYITSDHSVNTILEKISSRTNIIMRRLYMLVEAKYNMLRSILLIGHDRERKMLAAEYESYERIKLSKPVLAADIPMKEAGDVIILPGTYTRNEDVRNGFMNYFSHNEHPNLQESQHAAGTSSQSPQLSPVNSRPWVPPLSSEKKYFIEWAKVDKFNRPPDPYHRAGLMGNVNMYRKLIKRLVNGEYKRFIEKHSNYSNAELIAVLTPIYTRKYEPARHVHALRLLLENHREKLEKDMENYLINPREILYPPNHEKYTQEKLFPFLEKNISRIFRTSTYPVSVPSYIITAALEHISVLKGQHRDDLFEKKTLFHLRYQSMKWLATKLIPEEFHAYITTTDKFNHLLPKIMDKGNITKIELQTLINKRYREIRLKFCGIDDAQEEMNAN